MLEGAEGIVTEVPIKAGMFCNEAVTIAREHIIGEQVAGSLRELQEKVKVLEEAVHDMVFIMGQKEEPRRRGGELKPSQRKPSPKGCHKGKITDVGRRGRRRIQMLGA